MSIFASYVTRIVPLPFDEPQTVTIQKLSGKALEAARQARIADSMEFVRSLGGAAFGRELAAATAGREGAAEVTAGGDVDPLRKYDRATVLAKGVKAWTYDEALTPDRLDDLDEQAADFLAREILALTLPNGDGQKKSS
jgi:hypothetical protein